MSDPHPDRAVDHERDTELLDTELPSPRYVDASYLRWLYDENPLGPGFCANADEEGQRMAHYAVVPQRYRDRDGAAPFVFSLHAVTRSTAQRKGYFSTLGEQIFEEARQWGALGVIGVANDNSTPPTVKRMKFRLVGPLPVRVVPRVPRAGRDVQSFEVKGGRADDRWFDALAGDLAAVSAEGWTNCWTADFLRWRLDAPHCGPFFVHVGQAIAAISTVDRFQGRPVAIVLKLVPRQGRAVPAPANALVSAVCRFHGAPFAVYAGFNRHVTLRGLRPPRRFQPSPLNLIYRSLSERAPQDSFSLDTFEFLDMDAY